MADSATQPHEGSDNFPISGKTEGTIANAYHVPKSAAPIAPARNFEDQLTVLSLTSRSPSNLGPNGILNLTLHGVGE